MSNSSGPAHRSVSNIRPLPTVNQGYPGNPQTPLRTIPSSYGSPSALRAEEDCVIIELGSRYLRAGFAGDALPKAVVGFGPEEQRRAGDFRKWNVGHDKDWRKRMPGKEWGGGYELWKLDLRIVDLRLVGDRIERAVREASTRSANKHCDYKAILINVAGIFSLIPGQDEWLWYYRPLCRFLSYPRSSIASSSISNHRLYR